LAEAYLVAAFIRSLVRPHELHRDRMVFLAQAKRDSVSGVGVSRRIFAARASGHEVSCTSG
jgi:hypothetical protein